MDGNVMKPEEIVFRVKPVADKYKIKEVYLFGSYARGEATDSSDIDFLVYGGKGSKLTMIFAFAEELRKALQKDVDVFEIHEINEDSDFYKEIMRRYLFMTMRARTGTLWRTSCLTRFRS